MLSLLWLALQEKVWELLCTCSRKFENLFNIFDRVGEDRDKENSYQLDFSQNA